MSIERNKEYEAMLCACLHERGARDARVSFFIDTSSFAWPMVRAHADFVFKGRKFSFGIEMSFEDWANRYASGTALGFIDMAKQEIAEWEEAKVWAELRVREQEARDRAKWKRTWRKFFAEHPLIGA